MKATSWSYPVYTTHNDWEEKIVSVGCKRNVTENDFLKKCRAILVNETMVKLLIFDVFDKIMIN